MIDENHPMRAAGNFFGRRHGKPLRPHQSNLFEDLLPRLKLDLATPAPQDLRSLFEAPVETVRMEIGFGGGASTSITRAAVIRSPASSA
ncbi:tRNA (guanine-N(7)-)-methyltransferase [Brucella sp. 63/311]|nr:tRNA (guanine-N(7)-)-methyltransferase [Brucella sp. 63/311]